MDTLAPLPSRFAPVSPEAAARAEARQVRDAASGFEAILLQEVLRDAFSGSLEGPAGDVALTAFAESLAKSGAVNLAASLLKGVTTQAQVRPADRQGGPAHGTDSLRGERP